MPGKVTGQCFERNFAFSAGELLNYNVVYNWKFIWLNAGEVSFGVKKGTYRQRDAYCLYSYGNTYKGYDWFYKVRDTFRTYLDMQPLRPLRFHRNSYEGGYQVNNRYVYDYNKEKIYSFTENSNKPYVEDTLELSKCTFDVLSLCYYARNLDFSGLKVNDTIPVRSVIDNELFNLYIRYLGKVYIETASGDKYRCIKFSALLVEGTIFEGGEDLFVWVSDDKNRIPILVEAKILVGSVKAVLKDYQGLRNPFDGLVETGGE